MSLLPWGCRAWAVKTTPKRLKTTIDSTGTMGINLGRSYKQPGAFEIWSPSEGRMISSSETYFDESLFPWRPAGDQRPTDPVPQPGDADESQPPSLPLMDPDALSDGAKPLGTLAEEFRRVASERNAAKLPKTVSAQYSTKVLVLFSGPYARPDGLIAFLQRHGLSVVPIDNNENNGGKAEDNLLDNDVYEPILRRVQRGEFLAVFAAPPCSTFSVSRFIRSPDSKDGGPPVIRMRSNGQVIGIKACPAKHRRELRAANELVRRTCTILRAAADAGTEFAIENPADRGDPSLADQFINHEHAPIWLMPEMQELQRYATCRSSTFPMCAFGRPYQKQTTLMYSPGLAPGLDDLNFLKCTHADHKEKAGGSRDSNDEWNSAAAAAYPAELNLIISYAIANLRKDVGEPALLPEVSRRANKEKLTHYEEEERLHSRNSRQLSNLPVAPPAPIAAPALLPPQSPAYSQPSPAPAPDSMQAARGTTRASRSLFPIEEDNATPHVPAGIMRDIPTPDRPDLVAARIRPRPRATLAVDHNDGTVLLVSDETSSQRTTTADPKNHAEAMRDDDEGWTKAERKELDNHTTNKSFELLDRSEFEKVPPGRRLVKLVWVYKRKRNGKLKARLCVQGCSQQPGVDFDQTHCATLRGPSLRMLSALASKHSLNMRRWDFVSAFLQGDLQDGEVVYCQPPPGPYSTTGSDGRPRVWKVMKPVYGMAQAGRRWQRTLFPWLIEWGLTPCNADSCVFHLHRTVQTPNGPRKDVLIVGCYVDDLFILYNSDDEYSLYHQFTSALQKRWDVDDEGPVSDLLNIEIHRDGDKVLLRQTSYIEKMVKEWLPDGVPTHIQINSTPHDDDLRAHVLDAVTSEDPVDPMLLRKYQSIVGGLLYAATNTRPDIAFTVGLLCRAMSKPTPELFNAALRVLSYLYRHRYIGLCYEPSSAPLEGMTDSDWAVRHSTSGYVFTLARAAISWSSKRQPTIALSSCEAEIMAASEAAKEAVFLNGLISELGFKDDSEPIHLHCDNKAAVDSAYNPENHARTKHIDRRHYFIRELVEDGKLVVPSSAICSNRFKYSRFLYEAPQIC